MANYFNTLNCASSWQQLGKCRFMGAMNSPMARATFRVKVVIVGCGAQGLNWPEHA